MKKAVRYTAIILIILALMLAGYVIYVFTAYERLPDKLTLEVNKTEGEEMMLVSGQPYTVMTYNIGFGAYLPEYSFFMDGGKSSWGKDADSVTAAVCGAAGVINDADPDFVLLQEV